MPYLPKYDQELLTYCARALAHILATSASNLNRTTAQHIARNSNDGASAKKKSGIVAPICPAAGSRLAEHACPYFSVAMP
jgi:hypothetical protein